MEKMELIGMILIILIAVCINTYMLYSKYKEQGSKAVMRDLQTTVFSLMLAAQKKWGQGPGQEKLSWVVKQVYLYIAPDILDKFAPDVEVFVLEQYRLFYRKFMDYLDDSKINDSYREATVTTLDEDVYQTTDEEDLFTDDEPPIN